MFKRNYPAAVLAAVFAQVAARKAGEVPKLSGATINVSGDEYTVAVSGDDHTSLTIRHVPGDRQRLAYERRQQTMLEERDELRAMANVRLDKNDPDPSYKKAKDKAVARLKVIETELKTIALQIEDLGHSSDERVSLTDLAKVDFWVVTAADGSGIVREEAPSIDGEDDQEEGLTELVHDYYDRLREFEVQNGREPMPVWEAADSETVAALTKDVSDLLADPDATPAKLHTVWLKQMIDDEWTQGPELSVESKTHPAILPYEALPADVRNRDEILLSIVQTARAEASKPKARRGGGRKPRA